MKIVNMHVQGLDSPLGIQTRNPVFDYMLGREGQDAEELSQGAYRLFAATKREFPPIRIIQKGSARTVTKLDNSRWLIDMGFNAGDKITADCRQGRLVITKDEPQADTGRNYRQMLIF